MGTPAKPEKCRMVIEFDSMDKMKQFIWFNASMFQGDVNLRQMDSLDFQKMWSSFQYWIIRRHSQIPAESRLFDYPIGD